MPDEQENSALIPQSDQDVLVAGLNKELLEATHAHSRAVSEKRKSDAASNAAQKAIALHSGNIAKLNARISALYK